MDTFLNKGENNQDQSIQNVDNLSLIKDSQRQNSNIIHRDSKLDNKLLFKEDKQIEQIQQNALSHSSYAINECLRDKIKYLIEEKNGIQKTLLQQIEMYKEIINHMQSASSKRVLELQERFSTSIKKLLDQKTEESKLFNSQKEALQTKIKDLEHQLEITLRELNQSNARTLNQNQEGIESIQLISNKPCNQGKQISQLEEKKTQGSFKSNTNIYSLMEEYQKKIEQLKAQSVREKEFLAKNHQQQMDQVKEQYNEQRNKEEVKMERIISTLQRQEKRLNERIRLQGEVIQTMRQDYKREQERNANLKEKYKEEISQYTKKIQTTIRQEAVKEEKFHEIVGKHQIQIAELAGDNAKLRQLLMESSVELENCKRKIELLSNEKQLLADKLCEKEHEASTWRETYYLNKRRTEFTH